MRKICFYTGGRAEYGLLYWIMKEVLNDPELDFHLIVSGAHFDKTQGNSIDIIRKDGFPISKEIQILSDDRSPKGLTKAMGKSLTLLADALEEIKPDIGVVLGDRYEILTFAQACMMQNIPIAHIHGGESTGGLIDDVIRNAVTKMSHIHFASTDLYKNKIISLGENPKNVFNTGAPGIDNIKKLKLKSKSELLQELKITERTNTILVTYHPLTLYPEKSELEYISMLDAISTEVHKNPDTNIIITMPNIEVGSIAVIKAIKRFQTQNENVYIYPNLGQLNYLSMVSFSQMVIGNSSSGIVEVPSFGIPTINIGDRQKGRLRCSSIIDCRADLMDILGAIKKAKNKKFLEGIKQMKPLYGNGDASIKIKETLKRFSLEDILYKEFSGL